MPGGLSPSGDADRELVYLVTRTQDPPKGPAVWLNDQLPRAWRFDLYQESHHVCALGIDDDDGRLLRDVAVLNDVYSLRIDGGRLSSNTSRILASLHGIEKLAICCPEHIVEIDPYDLAKLNHLELLELRNVKLVRPIGNAWHGLAKLKQVSIHAEEPIDVDPVALGDLASGTELRLENVCLPRQGEVMGNWELLSLHFAEPTEVNASRFARLINLQNLDLRNVLLPEPKLPPWDALHALHELTVEFAEPTTLTPACLSTLSGIEKLSVRNVRSLASIAETLRQLNPPTLWIVFAEPTELDPAWLMSLRGVRDLTLGNVILPNRTTIRWEDFKNLSRLAIDLAAAEELDLSFLSRLSGLTRLRLGNVRFSAANVARLGKLHALQVLELQHCGIGDDHLVHLAELEQLKRLDLRDSQVAGPGLSDLSERLANLEHLDLSGTPFSDSSVRYLSNINVMRLWLDRTKLSDAGLADLADRFNRADRMIVEIGKLYVRKTGVTAAGARAFRRECETIDVFHRVGFPE